MSDTISQLNTYEQDKVFYKVFEWIKMHDFKQANSDVDIETNFPEDALSDITSVTKNMLKKKSEAALVVEERTDEVNWKDGIKPNLNQQEIKPDENSKENDVKPEEVENCSAADQQQEEKQQHEEENVKSEECKEEQEVKAKSKFSEYSPAPILPPSVVIPGEDSQAVDNTFLQCYPDDEGLQMLHNPVCSYSNVILCFILILYSVLSLYFYDFTVGYMFCPY